MAKFPIIWSQTALKQRRQIFEYWNQRNGNSNYSKKILNSINSRLEVLLENPLAFKETELFKIREIAMNHYSIYYKLYENRIGIISFWDNRQDPDKLLEILK